MRKKKQETAGGARHLPGLVWEDPATWRILLGPRLADEFFEAAGQQHPLDHLRHIVAEYYYLEQMGGMMSRSREKCSPLDEYQEDLEPLRELWAAVILRAVNDLRLPDGPTRDSAVWFLTSPRSHCVGILAAMGVDYDEFRWHLRPYLEDPRHQPRQRHCPGSIGRPAGVSAPLPLDIRSLQRARRIVREECERAQVPPEMLRRKRPKEVAALREEIARRVFLDPSPAPERGMRAITHEELGAMIGVSRHAVANYVKVLRRRAKKGRRGRA